MTIDSRPCPGCGAKDGEYHRETCPYRVSIEPGAPKPPLQLVVTLPPEVEQYAPDIGRFIDAMVYKLGVKAHKGKWENMTLERCLDLLRGEEKELTEAVARGNMVEILLEAADVANFALIASAIAMEKK